jgi:4-hydroxy-2-oxoheptanedioate aldolase
MVNTPEQAEQLVQSCKYPPRGSRSNGPVRASLYAGTDYWRHANDTLLCIPMIETAEAVKNIDAILSVPGVDACYVGPNDWCASCGLPPSLEPPHREFEDAMRTVFAAAQRHRVVPGIHCATADTVNRRIADGWRLVGMIKDQRFLVAAARAARDAVCTEGGPG